MDSDYSRLLSSTLVLLQEFWGYKKQEASQVVQYSSELVKSLAEDIHNDDQKVDYLKNMKAYLKDYLIPTTFNVHALNHGEINAICFAGNEIWRKLHKNTNQHPSRLLPTNAVNFVIAVFVSQYNFEQINIQPIDKDMLIPSAYLVKNKASSGPYDNEESVIQTRSRIQFNGIMKWLTIGFIFLFILCFLLLKLFA